MKKKTITDTGDAIVVGQPIAIPSEHRARLLSYANAQGYDSIAAWCDFHVNECDDDADQLAEFLQECVDETPIEGALRIMWFAGPHDAFPWGSDPWPKHVRTEVDFRAEIDVWATPEAGAPDGTGRITEEEADWMRELAEAALALDGKRAHELCKRIERSWAIEPMPRHSDGEGKQGTE